MEGSMLSPPFSQFALPLQRWAKGISSHKRYCSVVPDLCLGCVFARLRLLHATNVRLCKTLMSGHKI